MNLLVVLVCALLHWSFTTAVDFYSRLLDDETARSERANAHDRGYVTPESLVNTPWRKGAITWQNRLLKSQRRILDIKFQRIDDAAFQRAASVPAVKARTDRVHVGAHMNGHIKAFEDRERKVRPFMERGAQAYNEHTTVHQKTWDAAYEVLRNQHPGRFAAHEFKTKLKGALFLGPRPGRMRDDPQGHGIVPTTHGPAARSAGESSYHTALGELETVRSF